MILVCSGIPFLLMHMGVLKSFMHFLGIANGTPCKRTLRYSLGFLKKHIVHTRGEFATILQPYTQWLAIVVLFCFFVFFVKRTRNIAYRWIVLSSFFGVLYIIATLILNWGSFFNYHSGAQMIVPAWCYYGVWIIAVGLGSMFVNYFRDIDKEKALEERQKSRGGGLSGY